jgi:hypothetical protein
LVEEQASEGRGEGAELPEPDPARGEGARDENQRAALAGQLAGQSQSAHHLLLAMIETPEVMPAMTIRPGAGTTL